MSNYTIYNNFYLVNQKHLIFDTGRKKYKLLYQFLF